MEDRNLRELQARIEMLEARLARTEGRPTARLVRLLAGIGSSRRAKFAVGTAIVAVAAASYAATISLPYTFVNGQIADANQVNANFNTLVAESNDQDSRIAALEGSVASLQGDVATNTGNIATNTTNIGTNTSGIATNTSDIATNTSDIATNTSDIATNTSDIATNTSHIATNTSDIGALNTTFAGVSRAGTLLSFSGMNVQVVDGSGTTPGAIGLGNLIVGYNENSVGATRTGSHNLVVGRNHEYTGFAGLVAGYNNTLSANEASVTGGYQNTASGYRSSVTGGIQNTASGTDSSVGGGYSNEATTNYARVSGGYNNAASHNSAVVAGGVNNATSAIYEIVPSPASELPCASQVGNEVIFEGCNVNVRNGTGTTSGTVNGLGNLILGYNENAWGATRAGSHNLVAGINHEYTSYGGVVIGERNTIDGSFASVTGGYRNTASGLTSNVSGGNLNVASATDSGVSGGYQNTASGGQSSVCGGNGWDASAPYSSAIGPVPVLVITGP
jgi:hypothetical protein